MTEEQFPIIERPVPGQERPLVVSIPHSGVDFPGDEQSLYAVDTRTLLADGDLYVDELYRGAHTLGATVIRTPWNRFVVDLNRLEDDVSPRGVVGARRRTGEGYYGDRGLIWALTTRGDAIYHRPLSAEAFERRRDRYYRPYHAAIAQTLAELREAFGYAILLDAHSMPSTARSLHRDPVGRRRADIVPGDLEGQSCSAAVRTSTVDFWRGRGYSVTPNRPYRGGGITRRHGHPERGIHAIQLELRRGLYMDEHTLERSDRMARLGHDCLDFVRTLAALDPAHPP